MGCTLVMATTAEARYRDVPGFATVSEEVKVVPKRVGVSIDASIH